MPRFVQFPHPGPEATPDNGDFIHWNTTANHRRKFMEARGRWVAGEESGDGLIWFWGEWEPESKVIHKFNNAGEGLPNYLWQPHWIRPAIYQDHQNTDPCVFGGFYYAICRQNEGNPDLKELPIGSVIIFGSDLHGQWVLDTVFVVADKYEYNPLEYQDLLQHPGLRFPNGYQNVVLEPGCCGTPQLTLTLYIGATYENRCDFDGMFSFFPCKPKPNNNLWGFRRPKLDLPEKYFTRNLRQAASGATEKDELPEEVVKDLWTKVKDQVLQQKLNLGIEAEFPQELGRRQR